MNEGLVRQLDAAASRPVIRVQAGSLPIVVEQAEQALAATGSVYQRATYLVRVARVHEPSGSTRSLVILPLDADFTRLDLGKAADWLRWDIRAADWRPTDPPLTVARILLAAAGHWPNTPTLAGIVEAPTLRTDGGLLQEAGYDVESCLNYDPNGASFPHIAQAPSIEEARAALHRLLKILEGFPFVKDCDRAVAVSAILTALVRRSLRSAPMFVFTAPKMASGKTLLASIVSYIATGRPPPMMSQVEDPESERKRILALLLEGAAIVVIDNIERPLKSDTLCSILTEPVFADRILGASRTVTVPTSCTWVATGNNVAISGDLSTRVLVCELDPACERPEERQFSVDLHTLVPAQRAVLAAAGLTIIRAYLTAGSPQQSVQPFGRFEAWARWCRDPLLWLGLADACAGRERVEGRDPVREPLRALLHAWHASFGKTPTTVAAAIRRAEGAHEKAPAPLRDLSQAMSDVAGDHGQINARRLGKYLSRHERRIEDGLRFETGEARRGVSTWRVVGLEGLEGLSDTPTRESQVKESDHRETNP